MTGKGRSTSTLAYALASEVSRRASAIVNEEALSDAFSTTALETIVRRATRRAVRESLIALQRDAQVWLDANPEDEK